MNNNCPKCGNAVPSGASTCPICGNAISNIAAALNTIEVLSMEETQTIDNKEVIEKLDSDVTIQEITPTIEVVRPTSVIPNTIASSNSVTVNTNEETNNKVKKKKLKLKKSGLIIIIVLVLILGGSSVLLLTKGNNSKKDKEPISNVQETPKEKEEVQQINTISNGYSFQMLEDWNVIEDGADVIITNASDSLVIKLENLNYSINTLDADSLKETVAGEENYTNVTASKTTINNRECVIINAQMSNYFIQYYYLATKDDTIIGATVIYQSDNIKNENEANVQKLLGSLSFSDESLKAIDTTNMYDDVFNKYEGIIKKSTKK